MAEDKGHKPSKKKLEKARKEGKTYKSQILSQAVGSLACFASFIVMNKWYWVRTQILLQYLLVEGFSQPVTAFRLAMQHMLHIILPVLLVSVGAYLAIETFQVGLKIEFSLVAAKFSRIDLIAGLKRIFSGLKRVWEVILKLAILLFFFYWFFGSITAKFALMLFDYSGESLRDVYYLQINFWLSIFSVLVVLGLFEYMLRRREFMREMSMSTKDLRDEYKESEGDPLIRMLRKSMHESLAMAEVVQSVRKSKVIIVERST